jgi:hypothetical protein
VIHDDDLNAVLRRMCPQGFALLALEHGTPMLRLGARELLSNPLLAVEALGPRGAKALAHALLAVGEQHVAVAEGMLKLADKKAGGEADTPSGGRVSPQYARARTREDGSHGSHPAEEGAECP